MKVGGLGFGVDIFVNMFSFSVSLVFAPRLRPFRCSCFFYKQVGVEGFRFRFWGLGFKVGGLGFGIDIFVNMFSFSVGLVFAARLRPFRRACFL